MLHLHLRIIFCHTLTPTSSTCTTRHNQGIEDVPKDHLSSFIPIEPSFTDTNRPTVRLADDPDRAFDGKTLLFVHVAVIAFDKFFMGYVGSIDPKDQSLISAEFLCWQVKRVIDPFMDHSFRLTSIVACLHAGQAGDPVVGPYHALAVQLARRVVRDDDILKVSHLSHFVTLIESYLDVLEDVEVENDRVERTALGDIKNHESRRAAAQQSERESHYQREPRRNYNEWGSSVSPSSGSGDSSQDKRHQQHKRRAGHREDQYAERVARHNDRGRRSSHYSPEASTSPPDRHGYVHQPTRYRHHWRRRSDSPRSPLDRARSGGNVTRRHS